MEYAKSLVPASVLRRIGPALVKPRHFWLSAHDRRRQRGVAAASLDHLLREARSILPLSARSLTLVLEEDGTAVDTEDLFTALPDNTELLVLEEGQTWIQFQDLSICQSKRACIATITLSLYKLQPTDLMGCLNISIGMYDAHVASYDIQCTGARRLALSCVRLILQTTNLVAHLLLRTSAVLLHHLADDLQT